MQSVFTFLTRLRENNNRDWFESNKAEYEATRAEFEAFVGKVIQSVSAFEPTFASLKPKDCIFRLYRDVRFSKDKTPYKTSYSAYFSEQGKKTMKAGYYLHVEPGNQSMLAGGMYMPPAEELKKIRQEIDYNREAFRVVLENKDFKKYYGGLSGEQLKTVPKGYASDHPDIALLKYKDFTAVYYPSDKEIIKPAFVQHVADAWKALKPLNDFLNSAVA